MGRIADANFARFEVVVTARSAPKGQRIIDGVSPGVQERVSYTIVEDVAEDDAFDDVSQATPSHRPRPLPLINRISCWKNQATYKQHASTRRFIPNSLSIMSCTRPLRITTTYKILSRTSWIQQSRGPPDF